MSDVLMCYWNQVDDSEKIESLQAQLDDLDEKLRKEQAEHKEAKDVIEELKAMVISHVNIVLILN